MQQKVAKNIWSQSVRYRKVPMYGQIYLSSKMIFEFQKRCENAYNKIQKICNYQS